MDDLLINTINMIFLYGKHLLEQGAINLEIVIFPYTMYSRKYCVKYTSFNIYNLFSPQNENLDLLIRIKILNKFVYSSK